MADDLILDVADPRTFEAGHPHHLYDRQREQDPVRLNPSRYGRPAYWVVTSHDGVQAVSRNNSDFTSTAGSRLYEQGGLVALPETIRTTVNSTLASQDPPQHGELRKAISPTFLPSGMRRLEEGVERFVETLLDSFRPNEEIEFVSRLAAVVPIRTLCVALGIPLEDEHRTFDWTNGLVGSSDPEYAKSPEATADIFEEVFAYGRKLVDQRRAQPRDDLATLVATMTLKGELLEGSQRNAVFMSLLAAGNETTRNSLTGAILALHQFPNERRRLVEDPDLIGPALDELQRFVTPVIQMMRTATAPVDVLGRRVEPGQQVVMLYGAANRDPVMFEQPHRLDVRRGNANRQLSFGIGIHHCLGAPMARLQLRIILRGLLRRFPNFEVLSEPDSLRSNFVAGIKRLQVRLT